MKKIIAEKQGAGLIEEVTNTSHLHRLPPRERNQNGKKLGTEPGLAREPYLHTSDADLIRRDAQLLPPHMQRRLPPAHCNEEE